jgi:RNA polymerase sigma factor (sigma-70 family)
MATRMQQRRGTASAWLSANTVLTAGELGYETDTGQFKIGDGTTAWLTLPYFKDTLDLDIAGKAPINSPTFTGTVVLPSTTSIGDVSSSELAVLNGITSSTAELNILDGVTADASELNRLDGLLASETQENIQKALGELPEIERQILMLKYAEGWSYKELASHLGVQEDTIEYRLLRARKNFRRLLVRFDDEGLGTC